MEPLVGERLRPVPLSRTPKEQYYGYNDNKAIETFTTSDFLIVAVKK